MGLFDLFFGNNNNSKEKEMNKLRAENARLKSDKGSFITIDDTLAVRQQSRKSNLQTRLDHIENIPDVPGVVVEYLFWEEVSFISNLNRKRANEIETKMAPDAEGFRSTDDNGTFHYENGEKIYW